MKWVTDLLNMPFKAYRETASDSRSGLISAMKNAFSGSFYVAAFVVLLFACFIVYANWHTPALPIEGIDFKWVFGTFVGAYTFGKIADKGIDMWGNGGDNKPPAPDPKKDPPKPEPEADNG